MSSSVQMYCPPVYPLNHLKMRVINILIKNRRKYSTYVLLSYKYYVSTKKEGKWVENWCFLHSMNFGWRIDCFRNACIQGNVAILQYLLENDWPRINRDYLITIRYGHLSCMKLLRSELMVSYSKNGFECTMACTHGHVNVLAYLRETGCPINLWSSSTRLGVLRFPRSQFQRRDFCI